MRLEVPSASLIAVFTASQTSLRSNVAVAAVDSAYEVESYHQDINSFGASEECFFAKRSYLRDNAVDVGILQACSDPGYVCIEDSTSSLGGICILDEMVERELQTTCTKCTPASACAGLSATFIANNIGAGSCCGDKACQGITGEFVRSWSQEPPFKFFLTHDMERPLKATRRLAQIVVLDTKTVTSLKMVRR